MSDERERDELIISSSDDALGDSEAATARVRRLILARRNHFVAAALAGLGIGCSSPSSNRPSACLRVAAPKDGGPGDADAGMDGGADGAKDAAVQPGDDEDGGLPEAGPKVCLTIT